MPSGRSGAQARGFVYIALLIGLAVVGVGLGATAEVWTQTRQREKEQELLYVGQQMRQAITRFYLQSPPAARRFPLTLEELLEDTRTPDKPQRFLRKLYADPMGISNSNSDSDGNGSDSSGGTRSGPVWGEVRLDSGQLVGVYSLSQATPIKQTGFALRDKAFQEKEHYADWVFRSALPAANPVLAAGAGYSTPGVPGVPATRPGAPQPRPATPLPPGVIQPLPRSR